jgi:hypothetical protein
MCECSFYRLIEFLVSLCGKRMLQMYLDCMFFVGFIVLIYKFPPSCLYARWEDSIYCVSLLMIILLDWFLRLAYLLSKTKIHLISVKHVGGAHGGLSFFLLGFREYYSTFAGWNGGRFSWLDY